MRKRFFTILAVIAVVGAFCVPQLAFADENEISDGNLTESAQEEDAQVEVKDGEPGSIEDGEADNGTANAPNGPSEDGELQPEPEENNREQPSETVSTETLVSPDTTVAPAKIEDEVNVEVSATPGPVTQKENTQLEENSATVVQTDKTAAVPAKASTPTSKKSKSPAVQTATKQAPAAKASAKRAPAVQASAKKVKSGWYTIKSKLGSKLTFYMKGLGTAKGTPIVLKKNGANSVGSAFILKKAGKYYRLFIGISKKKFVQVGSSKTGYATVAAKKKSKSSLFKLVYDRKFKGYRFVNAKTGLALTVSRGKAKNGCSIVARKASGKSKAQVFTLSERPGLLTKRIYSMKTIQKGKRALSSSGSKAVYRAYKKRFSQKWYIAPAKGKKNVYVIESISTGKRLAGHKNKQVAVKKATTRDKATWWVPSFGKAGVVLKNYKTKKPLSTSGKKCKEGSKALNKRLSPSNSREFKLTAIPAVESGTYEFTCAKNGQVIMEVTNGNMAPGATMDVKQRRGADNQKWIYNPKKHTLKNASTRLVLDIQSADGKEQLVQNKWNGSDAQKWSVVYAGSGKYQIVSRANKKIVIASADSKAGSGVSVQKDKNKKLQKWKIKKSHRVSAPKAFNLIKSIVKSGHDDLYPSYIVIHETANPGASARNHRDLWSGENYYSDYAVHYTLDWTGDCYYCVPENRMCWQVGYGNPYVIGIELCHATNRSDFNKVWTAGAEWAAWQLKKHGWGIDRLISHNECRYLWGGTDHTDPDGYFEAYGKSWGEFKDAVARILAK